MNDNDRRQLRADLLDELDKIGLSPNDHQSEADGRRVVERALEEWRQHIAEPTKRTTEHPILNRYIKAALGWEWIDSYQNRKFAWCGAFAAFCWFESTGNMIRQRSFASTYRLQQWAKGSAREIDLSRARAGDLVVVGRRKAWGDHITILERIEGETLYTIEGNAYGTLGDGSHGEGVIRRERDASEIAFIYRPLEVDL